MSKHTPAPWTIVEDRAPSSLEVFGGGSAIAELWRRADVEKEKADARLIAAAPELLEALQELIRMYERQIDSQTARSQAYAAIAKATGESK